MIKINLFRLLLLIIDQSLPKLNDISFLMQKDLKQIMNNSNNNNRKKSSELLKTVKIGKNLKIINDLFFK